MNTFNIKLLSFVLFILSCLTVTVYYKHKYTETSLKLQQKELDYKKLDDKYNDALNSITKQNKAIEELASKQKTSEKLSQEQIEIAKKNAVQARRKAKEINDLKLEKNKDACVEASKLFNDVIYVK